MTTLSTEMMLRQYRSHTKSLANGDKIIGMPGGVYDLFCDTGWNDPIRFRIVRFKDKTKQPQLIQINGTVGLSREYRAEILKELT
jgi:hypothetical protein